VVQKEEGEVGGEAIIRADREFRLVIWGRQMCGDGTYFIHP
jgi:hypothetical protein